MRRTLQAACCLIACVLLGSFLDEAGEFAGGRVTRWLVEAADLAWCLFAVALLVTFLRSRVGAWIALSGCALWAPLVIYQSATCGVLFSNCKSPAVWSVSLLLPAVVLAVTFYVSVTGVRRDSRPGVRARCAP